MGYSYQRYLIAVDDTIYRMANAAFDRMLMDPAPYRSPELAGQRVRTAEVVVGLVDREPVAVVRTSFAVLVVDDAGRVDADRYRKQQYARVETALAPAFAPAFADPDRDERSLTQRASSLLKEALGRRQLLWREPPAIPHLAVKGAFVWATVPARPRPLVADRLTG